MARRPRKSWKSSRRSIRNTSGRRTLTCCSPSSTSELSDPAAEHKVLEELAARDGDASRGLPAADGAGRGGRRLARRGEECAPPPGGQSADPGPAPPARPRRGAAGRARRGGDRLPRRCRCSTTPTRPRCTTAWRSSCARRASPTRPGARSSSRSRKRLGSATPIGSCSNWSNPDIPTPGGLPLVPFPSRRPQAMTRRRLTPARAAVPAGDRRGRVPRSVRPVRRAAAVARRRAPRRPRRGAELEGGRAVQERRLHVCSRRIRLGGVRRPGAAGWIWRRLGWRGSLGDRLARQRPELLLPPPATDVAQGQPRSDHDAADRRAAVRLSVPLHDRAGRPARSRRRKSWRCAAICSTAAS